MRTLLAALEVTAFAEVATPGGGAHFYIAGHASLPTVHSGDGDRVKLTGFPGVDIQSHGSNMYLPGTVRQKYDGRGYTIVVDNLAALADGGDPEGAESFADWVSKHRAVHKAESFTATAQWSGAKPDARQLAYLEAVVQNQANKISLMGPSSGRNNALYEAGLCCGNYIAGAGMDEGLARKALEQAAASCGLTAEDGTESVRATIDSGLNFGKQRPRSVPDKPVSSSVPSLPSVSSGGVFEPTAVDSTGSVGSVGSVGSFESNIEATETFVEVLDAVREHFGRYVMTVADSDLDILALWAVHTHLCEETYTTPRLVLDSPIYGSGKTTVLEHIERLALRPVQMSSVSSPALLVRMLANGPRTICVDEADRSLNPNKPGIEDILAILNSGYKRGATRPVLVPNKEEGWVAKEMSTFAPVAMAGNAPDLPDDTRSRCISVLLMPAQEGDVEETDWELIEAEVLELGARVAASADHIRALVKLNRPDVPKGCVGRMKERWLPLKRVAVAASPEWAARVDKLILDDLESEKLMREEGINTQPPHIALLHDIAAVIIEGEVFVETEDLLARLIAHNRSRWSQFSSFGKDLTAQRLGRMLVKNYRIHSQRQGDSKRGYFTATFAKTFRLMRVGGSVTPLKRTDGTDGTGEPTGVAR